MPICLNCSSHEQQRRSPRLERVAGSSDTRSRASPGFCTVTALGLVSQPKVMGKKNLPARLCTDTYLAALAISNGWRLVSFDHDFERFTALRRLTLI